MIHMTTAYTYQKKGRFVVTNVSYTPHGRTRVHIYVYMHRVLRARDMEAQSCGGSAARG